MARYGGSKTKGGFYWKKGSWEIVTIEGEEGRLPGTPEALYLRLPAILLGPAALTLGLAFYIFLPFIGFAMVLSALGKKIWGGIAHAHPAGAARRAS